MARAGRQVEFTGVFASAITPHRAETPEVDFSGALDLLDFLAGAGVRGVTLFDSTGEFLDYSFMERQRLVYLGSKRSRVPLLANVSHSTLAGAIQLANEAVAAGADGLLLMPPYFYPCSQPEIEEFYLQFARETAGAVPVLLQNTPRLTSSLAVETSRKLLDTGNFSGIDDRSGQWEHFVHLLQLKRDRPFVLLAGHERLALRALREGADGITSSCACAVPELVLGLTSAIASGDEGRADAVHRRLLEFVDWIEKLPAPTGIKRAVALRKQKSGPALIPLAPETSRLLEEFARWFVKWLPTHA